MVALSLVLVSTLASVAAGEWAARWFIQLPQWKIYPQVRYQPHPVRGFTLQAEQVAYTKDQIATVDGLGFRANGSKQPQDKANFRILALGDSFTFGYGVADQETWPARLEAIWEGKVRVINAGTTSYNVFHEFDLLQDKGILSRPELVIHGLYWNDHLMNRPPKSTDPQLLTADGHFTWDGDDNPASDPFWLNAIRWLKGHSVLVNAAMTQAKRYFTSANSGVHLYDLQYRKLIAGELDPEAWQVVDDFYRDIKKLGEEKGFAVYAVILPVRDIVSTQNAGNHAYPKQMRHILDRQGIPYLDGITLWQQAGLGVEQFLPYDEHLTASGYRILAEALAADLCARKLPAVAGVVCRVS